MACIRALLIFSFLSLVLYSVPVDSSATGLSHSTGVCTSTRSRQSSYISYRRSFYTVRQSSTYSCGFLWLSRCTRYRTRYVYYSVSYASYYITYYSVSQCCSGYQSIAGECRPVCTQGCVNGRCSSPNVCSCYSGWTGSSCQTDVNECDYNYCSHYCVNTPGYYSCSCPPNYYLSYDWHTCIDINECTNGQVTTGLLTGSGFNSSGLPEDWCEQRCINTPGNYSCGCFDGYQLDYNNQTCSDINECLFDNGGCDHTCNNTIGSYECFCDSGYLLLDDGHSCTDHCECCTGDDDCEQICINTVGSYTCFCISGYKTSLGNSSACEDINECTEGVSGCDQTCNNELGSYSCSCNEGYTLLGDNHTCLDINECNNTNGGCAHGCVNINGSYYCTCVNGYMLGTDGTSCEDIDECAENTSNCTQICSNTVGGYICGCRPGYSLRDDNITCTDINECTQGNGGCQHICDNMLGSFTCLCRPGYTKNNNLCIALSCPLLTPPTNGSMTCTGLQVTDENCTMSCSPGYSLIGSPIRSCLGSNQSWSGVPTECQRSQCSPLTSTVSSSIVYPCFNRYQDRCQFVCEIGYATSNGDFSWTQMCNVVNGSFVDWDSNRTCRVRNKCNPNPCSPGQCIVNMNNKVQCDCRGTYTMGERCQMAQIITEPVPVLAKGSSYSTRLISRLPSSTQLQITSSDNNSLIVSQSMISIRSGDTTVTVRANESGLYTLKYSTTPDSQIAPPDDILYLISPTESRSRRAVEDYFTLQGLERGQLGIGCCRKRLDLSPYQCTSNLTLHSYCQWNGMSATEGVTHISVHSLYLPLSVVGLQDNYDVFQNESSSQCISCDKGTDLQCQVAHSLLHFNSGVIHGIIQEKSLVRSFFKSIKSFIPSSWLGVQVYTSTPTQEYSVYDFISFIGASKELKSIVGCQDITLPDTPSSMVYSLRTTSQLLFTINSHPVFLYPTSSNPFCIAIDLCSQHAPFLHVPIPSILVNHQNLASMSILRPLIRDDNTQLVFKSIVLQEDGIDVSLLKIYRIKYWNGSHYFSPSLPRYQYGMNVILHKTFISQSSRLSVEMTYDGLMYYQPKVSNKEVPGLLVGNLTLNITNVVEGVNVSLILTSLDDIPALFSYPTGSPSQSSMPLGLSAALQYVPESSSTFYRNHFIVTPESTCLVDVSLDIDETLNINNVSFTSSCLSLRLKQLIFDSNKILTVAVLPGYNNAQNTMIFKASLLPTCTAYQVGPFYWQLSNDSSALVVRFGSTRDSSISGMLNTINVSLLDSLFTTNVSINNDWFNFNTDTKIYSSYDVHLVNSFSSLNGSLFVNGVFLEKPNSFRSDISSYLAEHLHSEIEDVLIRSNRTIESIRISKAWRDQLYDQLVQAQLRLSQMEDLVLETNSSYYTKKNEAQVTLNELKMALTHYNNSMSLNALLCGTCDNDECKTSINCYSYSRPLTLNVAGSCSHTVTVNQMKKQTNMVTTREWQYTTQCKSCWKLMWYRSLYLSQTTCCKGVKSPMDTYHYNVQYINSTVNITGKRLCTVDSNTETVLSNQCEATQCLYQVTNMSCVDQMFKCYQNLTRNFELVNATLGQLVSSYLERLIAVQEAKVNLTRAMVRLSQLKEKVDLLQSAYLDANMSYNININANHSLLEEANLYQPFVGVSNSPPLLRQLDVLQITNVSFYIEITNATPVMIPITISYHIVATGVTPAMDKSVNMSINLLQPRRYILRHISNRILKSYLSAIRSSGRTKRETMPSSSPGTLVRNHRFHDTCIELGTLKSYFQQILALLNDSMTYYNTSTTLINSAYNDTSLYTTTNISSIVTAQYESLKTDLNNHYNYFAHFLSNNSFAIWQAHLEVIHVMVSHVETFGCSSFLDCLGTGATLYEQILEDTPNSVQKLNELRNLKESIYQVGYNKSLTFKEGHNTLMNFYNLLSLEAVSQYWCIEPPVIISHPTPVLNMVMNSTSILSCQADSSLRLKYYWTKNNVIIVDSNSQSYTLTNVQPKDEGEYRCVAVNDAGSSTSLPAVARMTFKPMLNLTLPLTVLAYEGHYNGIDLSCDATGFPVPGWKWFYRQTQTDSWHQITSGSTNILTLNTPQLKDRGWYQCMAYNNIGNTTSNPMYLNILPTSVPKVKYSFTMTMTGMREDLMSTLFNSLQANVSSTVSPFGSLNSFGGSLHWLSFYIQAPVINPVSSIEVMTTHMASGITQLEQDRRSLSILLQDSSLLEQSQVSVDSYTVGPRVFECPAGFEIDTDRILCVACSPGSYGSTLVSSFLESGNGDYIEELTSQCNKCPLGTYQENGGQSSCVSCPSGHTTVDMGSIEQSNCQEMCSPHSYSSTGLQPCTNCPPKYYQLYTGQRSCLPCDNTTIDKIDVCFTLISSSFSSSSFSSTTITSSISSSITYSSTVTTLKVITSATVSSSSSIALRSPLPSAIGEEATSGFLSTTTFAIIGGSVLLVILIAIVCIVLVSLRIKKKKLHSQELRAIRQGATNPSVELNSYDTRSFQSNKSSDGGYDDIKGKLGDVDLYTPMAAINDPIYESLEDMSTEKRNSLWGPTPPSLPPPNTTNPMWLESAADGPPITDEYIKMSSSPVHQQVEHDPNYSSIN